MTKIRRDAETIAEITQGNTMSAQEDLGGQRQADHDPTPTLLPATAAPEDPDHRSLVPTVERWDTLTQQEKDEARKVASKAIAQLRGEADDPDVSEQEPGQQTLFD